MHDLQTIIMEKTPLKYLILGTGRCGTGLLQQMFNNANIKCGHEDIFKSSDENLTKRLFQDNTEYLAESSWASAPFVDKIWFSSEIKIVHLVRNPVKVIQSFWDLNFFSIERAEKPLNRLVYSNINIMPNSIDRLGSAIDHYYLWNNLIESKLSRIPNPSMTVRLEDVIVDTSALNIFLETQLNYTGKIVNNRTKEKSDADELDIEHLKNLIIEKYSGYPQYGYI